MSNFWTQLKKPIFALAPMADVTDVAFREMFAKYSSVPIHGLSEYADKPARYTQMNAFIMFTEFVNVDGLTHPEGYKRLSLDLKFSEAQRPIVGQIWGRDPQKFYEAAGIIANLGFDGVDINMGCPQDKEIGQGACAALIREPGLAKEIVEATKKGAGGLPVSIKTRLGYNKTGELGIWLRHLLETKPAAIALHARTKQEKSKVPAHWDAVKKAVKIRDEEKSNTLIIGNGDIKSRDEGLARINETGCDGVMVGRGAFGSPWFFRANNYEPQTKERLSAMLEHARMFEKEFFGVKSFAVMRKHFKAYANGFDRAGELRATLMETKNLGETEKIVSDFTAKLP